MNCPICKRSLETKNISKHHLIPKSKGGKHGDTVMLHNICHQKIHSLFTEKELAKELNTIEKLLEKEELQKFIKWVRKKEPSFYQRNATTNKKRGRNKQKGLLGYSPD
ncbi:MAG: HNH endonuclease [Saprospiraceae bacterium]